MAESNDVDFCRPRGALILKQNRPVVATQRLDNVRTIGDDQHGIFIDQRRGITYGRLAPRAHRHAQSPLIAVGSAVPSLSESAERSAH